MKNLVISAVFTFLAAQSAQATTVMTCELNDVDGIRTVIEINEDLTGKATVQVKDAEGDIIPMEYPVMMSLAAKGQVLYGVISWSNPGPVLAYLPAEGTNNVSGQAYDLGSLGAQGPNARLLGDVRCTGSSTQHTFGLSK